MTIIEAIFLADGTADNDIEQDIKLRWLSALDQKLAAGVYGTHVGTEVDFHGYDDTTDQSETELLVPAPWDELYVDYLTMRIYLMQNEIDRYNNAAVVYAESLRQFLHDYNTTHMPKAAGPLRF
jgi:hypothetical protein